jgi:asparagine synthase (glutamine-hydrolysing)
MYRCIALVWDREDLRAASVAEEIAGRLTRSSVAWKQVIAQPGLTALHAGAGGTHATSRYDLTSCETRAFDGNAGVLFGRAFSLGHELDLHPYCSPLSALETNRVCTSGGMHLIEQYWGRYFAVFSDLGGRRVSVIRDPTGGFPCFLAEHEGVRLVFSEIETVLSLGLLTFSVNWRYVASFVSYSALQVSDTGLNEVTEIQPGERVTFDAGKREREQLWKPAEIAARSRIESPVVAIAAVRETVRQCVGAWASLHRSVVHTLSGGLDSSIVLSALKTTQNQPRIACLHYYSPDTGEDEREYARLVARRLDAELVECPLDPTAARLDRLLGIRPSPKPWFYTYDLVHSPIEARLMNERGATGLFSGAGGDGLFIQARAELAVADFLRNRGIRPGLFGVALNAARINRSSVWPILLQGLLSRSSRKKGIAMSPFAEERSLIPREVYERVRNDEGLVHAWIRDTTHEIAPGLLWQILCNSVPSPFYESFGGVTDIERTPALVSQPLLELCLRIPTYVWISGGQNRSIARRAFSDALPPAIVRRTEKGLIDRYNRRMLDANAAFVSDMMLDGQLVKAGLLDRHKLEAAIRVDASSGSFEYNDVLRRHLCTEVWLRQWLTLTTSCAS